MKPEIEMIYDKLAYVRDYLFDEEDYISNDGYDLTGSYTSSAYEVLCGMEQKILRQQIKIKTLEKRLENAIFDDVSCDPVLKNKFKL